MGSDMGNISGHMTGRVIRGEDIERVLAMIPEQTWTGSMDWFLVGIHPPDFYEVPMAMRREIIAHVLAALPWD